MFHSIFSLKLLHIEYLWLLYFRYTVERKKSTIFAGLTDFTREFDASFNSVPEFQAALMSSHMHTLYH